MTDGCAGAIDVWAQGWRVWWQSDFGWAIDGCLRSYEPSLTEVGWREGFEKAGDMIHSWTSIFSRYEPLQAEFGRDIEWDRFLWSQEFMDYALFKAFAPSDPDIDGLRKWIIPTQPRKRSRLWSESHDPLPAVFQYTSQETL